MDQSGVAARPREPVHGVVSGGGQESNRRADEALSRWQEQRDRIALLFTDVIMPGGLTGKDLAERLRARRPDLKVVFCSGYDANILDADALQVAGTRFLTKPFDITRLAEVVRELLDAK